MSITKSDRPALPVPVGRGSGHAAFWWVALALTITFMGPNLPTPLYVRYAIRLRRA